MIINELIDKDTSKKGVLDMWSWFGMGLLIYSLFIILEETIYLIWNRYVYGPKVRKARLWKRIILGMVFFIRLHVKNKHRVNSEKQSA
jgi:hypothetical protein